MIATELLRHEFFTIFGVLDTRNMQHGKGFEAKVFRQVCQMLINAIGAAQHSRLAEQGKLGWCWERYWASVSCWCRCPFLCHLVSWCCS